MMGGCKGQRDGGVRWWRGWESGRRGDVGGWKRSQVKNRVGRMSVSSGEWCLMRKGVRWRLVLGQDRCPMKTGVK